MCSCHMLLEKIAGRELLPTVRVVTYPERSVDLKFMSEPKSASSEARSDMEAALKSTDIGAQVLHNMLPRYAVSIRSYPKMSGALASRLSWYERLVRLYSNTDIQRALLCSTHPAALEAELDHWDLSQ